jgi:L-threonine-O-3-phosphate decarboxylase
MDPASVREAERVPHGGTSDPTVLDFSANVNPERPAAVQAAYDDAFADSRRYPDDDYPAYRRAAAAYVDVNPTEVVPTAGGLAALRLVFESSLAPGDRALVPFPSFGEYAREISLQGATPTFVPQADLLDTDPGPFEVVVACTPNNPTGDLPAADALRDYAARCRDQGTLFVVDEAFLGFTDQPSLAGTPGVVVARSLTKLFGLPGLRAGFAVATGDTLDALTVARQTWTLGTPATRVGVRAMQDDDFVARTRARVRAERARLGGRLDALGFDVHASDAPFLLLDVGAGPGPLVDACLDRGVAIRDASTFRGLATHVRVAVRTPTENDRLLAVLEDVRD